MYFACLFSTPRSTKREMSIRYTVFAAACALASACGGTAPQAETVEPRPASTDEADAAAGATESNEEETSTTADDDGESEAAASPLDTLVREGTAFILNFEKSDIGIEEKTKCEKKSGGDVAKEANCYSAAMNKHPREGILFEKSGDGWIYVRFGLVKNARVDFNRVSVDIGEPQGNQIVLTPSGPDKAARRKGTVPKQLEFTVVDEYTIELDDPNRGKLTYEPKLGLFASE